jgi:hypothetical protein
MTANDAMAASGDDVANVPGYDPANPYSQLYPVSAPVVLPLVPVATILPNTLYPRP